MAVAAAIIVCAIIGKLMHKPIIIGDKEYSKDNAYVSISDCQIDDLSAFSNATILRIVRLRDNNMSCLADSLECIK